MTKPTFEDLIASARGDEPTAEQLQKLDGRLASLLPPGGGGGPSGHGGHGAAGGAGGGVALKWIAAGVVAVGGAVAVQQVVAHRSRPAVVASAPQIAVAPPPAPGPGPDAAPAPAPVQPPVIAPPVHRTPEVSLSAEATLLDRARRAIQHGDPRGALATCEAHAQKFGHGALREERERIAIEALVALGRRADAEARAQRFDRAFPNSVQSERIHALLRAR